MSNRILSRETDFDPEVLVDFLAVDLLLLLGDLLARAEDVSFGVLESVDLEAAMEAAHLPIEVIVQQ